MIFIQATLFPFVAAAQMMAPALAPMALAPSIIPSSHIPSVMPSIMVAPRSLHVLPAIGFAEARQDVPLPGAKTAKAYVDERFHLKARGAHLRKPFSGSRIFGYNTALQPSAETVSGLYNKTITRTYATSGVIGRSTGLNTGADYIVTYGYDPTGRFNSVGWTVNGISGTATYSYLTNSDLLASLTTGSGQLTTHTYEANRNLRTRVNNQFNAGTVSQYDYVSDGIGRRTSVANSGSAFSGAAFNRFAYNGRGELNESARYLGTDINNLTQPVTPEYRGFNYDPIGNRTNITVAASSGSYTANNLNQYSLANLPGGGSNTFTHDLDGNLTAISGSKNVTYTYDAENRLITAQPTSPAVNDKKLDMVYDYQGRRVRKLVSNWNGSGWVPETTKYFVYDGWNVVEEQTVSQPSRYYVWGLDLSQSLQSAGGIGGLLARVESTTTHNFLHDGNGNVTQLINATTGTTDAHYEYDPYGNTILTAGAQASGNPYRFSTKYLDGESGLYYYGHRYYDPVTGRWLSRDPIEEEGGVLLYGFNSNNPLNNIDPYGTAIETLWDIINVGTGIVELIVAPSWLGAGALIVDIGAAVVPGAPGGASTAVKASRIASLAAESGKVGKITGAAAKVAVKAGEGANVCRKVVVALQKMPYKELVKVKAKLGLGNKWHAHHIIEKRFHDVFNVSLKETDNWMAVALDSEEHIKKFTKRWKDAIPRGSDYGSLDPNYILRIAREKIYYDAPEILQNLPHLP